MLPITFDPDILSSLPRLSREAAARVETVLVAIGERRALPALVSLEDADRVRVARVSERYRITRLEDPEGVISLVSALAAVDGRWVIYLHERIFDYVAFAIPDDGAAIPHEGGHEARRALALVELILRHELEHAVFPERTENEVVRSDLRFIGARKANDPSYFRALVDVLRDETNGLRGGPWLAMIDEPLNSGALDDLIGSQVNELAGFAVALPAEVLVEVSRTFDSDLLERVVDRGLGRLRDQSHPVRRRAAMGERIRRVLHDLATRDATRLRALLRALEDRGGAAVLRTELEVPDAKNEEMALERLIAALGRGLAAESAPPVVGSVGPDEDAQRWREGAPVEPSLDGTELMGEAARLSLEQRVEVARADPSVPRPVLKAIDRNSSNLSGHSKAKYTEFVETLLAVPWGVIRPIDVGPREFAAGLDASHFGLDRPKELVADFFSNLIWRYRDFTPDMARTWSRTGSSYLFVGPPGVGKTSLAISIATNLGIPYHKVSLGGMRDESDLRGHGFTYEGSKPGAIVQGLIKMGVMNGMFILDEADKTESFAIATLLEILDPEQNHLFHDRYTQSTVDLDLSNCHFILTANTLETVPPPVLDRCQVVVLDRYSVEEKVAIARRHLIPRMRRQHAITAEMIDFEEGHVEEHLRYLIRNYTHEAGVRQLALVLRTLFLRIQRRDLLEPGVESLEITHSLIKRRLEQPRRPRAMNPGDRVGEVLGLGVDVERGIGEVIPIQATRIPGAATGGAGEEGSAVSMVHATGNIEKVMDESRRVATTGILHCAEGLGVDPRSTRAPVHLHFLGASTRKDGPSAGCAIALALTSLMSGRPIRRDVAVTGEIDTQGRITGVGGVDIKLETAVEAGCHTLIIPRENLDGPGGVARFPDSLKRELQILDYGQWRSDHEAFDPQRHVIQVVAVEHVTEAADIAILDESEIEALEVRFGDDGRRLARRHLEQGVASHRGPMVVVARDAAEADPARVQPALCADCAGCRLVVEAPLSEEINRTLRASGSGARTVVWDPQHEELGRIVASLDVLSDSGGGREIPVAIVAPYFALRDARSAIEARAPNARLLANNFSLQGVKLKSIRTVLDTVFCRLLHLGQSALEDVPFLAQHDGITVVDLRPIPEKYRLDVERAERILVRMLTTWINQVDETLATRRAS